MLDRPELIAGLRNLSGDRPVLIEPWNVTASEVALAEHLQAPINGIDPALRHLGFKSTGRRLFAEAGVPVPYGREDVRTVDEVVASVEMIQRARPLATSVVIKHDDSGAGDGNVVLPVREPNGEPSDGDAIRRRVDELPGWYVADLRPGSVVEGCVTGVEFSSPSVQLDVLPDGSVVVLATHEQVLSGVGAQVYTGCRFPAKPAYAGMLARHGRAMGNDSPPQV